MHVVVDLNWLLQFIVPVVAAAFGFFYLVRNTASRFFVVGSNFGSTTGGFSPDRQSTGEMEAAVGEVAETSDSCAVCGLITTKQCAGCKMVKYCSEACQRSHWNSEHKKKCKDLQSIYKAKNTKSTSVLKKMEASLVPAGGSSKIFKQSNKILFPYEEFLKYFNWDKSGYPPCGLLNCGNSCFANVVLQCLAYTRPLVAYLLEKGHKTECQMEDWCFLCEFQAHVERASQSLSPFSPINILSRLPNIGGNLGYGKQEDAHEFMRFAIDTMQSVCLDEFGGEKAVHPGYQETTLVQHIFGGRLQSQVICTQCNNVSDQFENMMDLTVEIHGDAGSLEECLDQFTAKESLHGDNMYKCDCCNAYVSAWKCLTVYRAPNILTIALKRFKSGRFGKLNKRVTFPERLNLSSYMSEFRDGNDVYNLYAVIVHVDMLNASFFGHYICYIKDFRGNWYRIDDCKVASVELDEVLSQGAYMLLYNRICARPSCLLSAELSKKPENENVKVQPTECLSAAERLNTPVNTINSSSANCSEVEVNFEEELTSTSNAEGAGGDANAIDSKTSLSIINDEPHGDKGLSTAAEKVASPVKHTNQPTPASTSLIDKGSIQPDAHNLEPISLIFDIEIESCASKSNANEGLIIQDKVGDVREENSVKMSNGESRGAKLKPVFAPGFLGKHPRKELIKQEAKAILQLRELTSKLHLDNRTNEVMKPYISSENGILLKDDDKTCSVLENGRVSANCAARKILENRNSGIDCIL